MRFEIHGDRRALGFIPTFLYPHDPRTTREQLHEGYLHGGGWQPFDGFTVSKTGETYSITYPGDPAFHEIARIYFRDDLIVLFPYSWVLLVPAEGEMEISRMD